MTIYDVFNLYSRILHEQFRESPSFLVLFVSLFSDTLFSCNNQNSMGYHGQNGPHSAISQNLALNLKYKGNRKGKQINILILCKNWTYMKFSGDYINLKKKIIILMTVASWEIHYRTYSF